MPSKATDGWNSLFLVFLASLYNDVTDLTLMSFADFVSLTLAKQSDAIPMRLLHNMLVITTLFGRLDSLRLLLEQVALILVKRIDQVSSTQKRVVSFCS
jgi:hypothetical protein